jgi:hypothetical protein
MLKGINETRRNAIQHVAPAGREAKNIDQKISKTKC